MFRLYENYDFTSFKLLGKCIRSINSFNMTLYSNSMKFVLFIIIQNKKIIIESDELAPLQYFYEKLEFPNKHYRTTERLYDIMIVVYKAMCEEQTKVFDEKVNTINAVIDYKVNTNINKIIKNIINYLYKHSEDSYITDKAKFEITYKKLFDYINSFKKDGDKNGYNDIQSSIRTT